MLGCASLWNERDAWSGTCTLTCQWSEALSSRLDELGARESVLLYILTDTSFSAFKFTAPSGLNGFLPHPAGSPQESMRVAPSPSHGPALCPTHLLPYNRSLRSGSGLSAPPQPHHLHPTSSPFSLLFTLGSLHSCSPSVSAVLCFITRNVCLAFVLIPGTNLLKPLEFPKW